MKRSASAISSDAVRISDDDKQEAPQDVQRRAYGIQFSDTKDPSRRRPNSFTRESFGCLLTKRHEEMFEERRSGSLPANQVLKVMVFRELHSNSEHNFYACVLKAAGAHATKPFPGEVRLGFSWRSGGHGAM